MNSSPKMDHTYWQKQTSEPLFPDIFWSRPESKMGAGKILIIGGNAHRFGAPGIAYAASEKTGAGSVRVLLPDAIRKIVKGMLPDADFAPSTPSGSFAKNALSELLTNAQWSDGVLLAGDFGRNSETAIVLESFVEKYRGVLTITQDAADYFKETPLTIIDRENTIVVVSLAQLQKIFISTPSITPIVSSMSSIQLAEALHYYTKEHPACIVTKHNDLIFVAASGQVSTTKHTERLWRVETSGKIAVFAMQNPQKIFEAATTSLLD
ncbi:hypothetical protein KC992_01945 [Candidatus Saccharibacteria bacterium]|nr:hypothetical protein [Candidatus Saccharibacteria bacterium]